MLTGLNPFDSDVFEEITQKIKKAKIEFPNDISLEAKDFILVLI